MPERRLILLLLPALVLTPTAAQAYIDPGSGGMVLQVIVGAIVGVGVALKLSWRRFAAFFSRRKPDDPES